MDRKRFWPFGRKTEESTVPLSGEVQVNRFLNVLEGTELPYAARFRAMVKLGTIKVLMNDQRMGFGFGEIDFVAGLDPQDKLVRAVLLVNSEEVAKLNDRVLAADAKNVLVNFEAMDDIAIEYDLDWKAIDDDKMRTFLEEASSVGGEDFDVINT